MTFQEAYLQMLNFQCIRRPEWPETTYIRPSWKDDPIATPILETARGNGTLVFLPVEDALASDWEVLARSKELQ